MNKMSRFLQFGMIIAFVWTAWIACNWNTNKVVVDGKVIYFDSCYTRSDEKHTYVVYYTDDKSVSMEQDITDAGVRYGYKLLVLTDTTIKEYRFVLPIQGHKATVNETEIEVYVKPQIIN